MSGGHFNYDQYRISSIADEIELLIKTNGVADEYGYARNYSAATIERFREAKRALEVAYVYVKEIDWLVSGDTGEESFEQGLKDALVKLDRQWCEEFPINNMTMTGEQVRQMFAKPCETPEESK